MVICRMINESRGMSILRRSRKRDKEKEKEIEKKTLEYRSYLIIANAIHTLKALMTCVMRVIIIMLLITISQVSLYQKKCSNYY